MQRVLSFQMGMSSAGRGFGESSEFVTKRMCFSFIFFFGFLSLLGGFLLGRMSTERNVQLREERKRLELAEDILEETGRSQLRFNLFFEELRNTSFDELDHFTIKKSEKNDIEDYNIDYGFVKRILSNSSLFYKVVEQRSSIVATLRGSQEPDRWIVVSVGGDGIIPALELVKILGKLRVDQNWEPQRTIIFCFSHEPHDSCRDVFSQYLKSRIVAYLAVHGNAIEKKGCLAASGSDIIRSVVLGVVQESIFPPNSNDVEVFEACKIEDDFKSGIFLPRLLSDIPHTSVSFKNSNSTNAEFNSEREILPYRRILTQIIGLSIWKLSDSPILYWNSNDFERSVRMALKMINSSQLIKVKEKIISTMEKLVKLNQRSNGVTNSSSLANRMTNDLLMDLDRALLCSDVDLKSKTDLALIPAVLSGTQETISTFLGNLLTCYENAVEVLQDG